MARFGGKCAQRLLWVQIPLRECFSCILCFVGVYCSHVSTGAGSWCTLCAYTPLSLLVKVRNCGWQVGWENYFLFFIKTPWRSSRTFHPEQETAKNYTHHTLTHIDARMHFSWCRAPVRAPKRQSVARQFPPLIGRWFSLICRPPAGWKCIWKKTGPPPQPLCW